MKALVFNQFGSEESEEIIDRTLPEPGTNQLAVSVRAAGVNPFDFKVRGGHVGTEFSLPFGMGTEAAGVVTAVGPDVHGFAVGDEVFGVARLGIGTFGEDTLLTASQTRKKPADLPWDVAASISVALKTAVDGLKNVELPEHATIVVTGIGPLGYLTAQVATKWGHRVIIVARNNKREFATEHGYSFVATDAETDQSLADRLRELAPEGADLVLDTIGKAVLREVAPIAKDPSLIISAAAKPLAKELGGDALMGVKGTRDLAAELAGELDFNITDRYPLSEAQEALAKVEHGHPRGKVVLIAK